MFVEIPKISNFGEQRCRYFWVREREVASAVCGVASWDGFGHVLCCVLRLGRSEAGHGISTGPWRNVGAVLGEAATTREEICCVGEYQLSVAGQSDGFQLKSCRNISKHCEIKQRVGLCENTCFRLMKRPLLSL